MGSPFFFLPDIDVQFHFFHGSDELSLEEKKRRHFISEKKIGGPGDVVWMKLISLLGSIMAAARIQIIVSLAVWFKLWQCKH